MANPRGSAWGTCSTGRALAEGKMSARISDPADQTEPPYHFKRNIGRKVGGPQRDDQTMVRTPQISRRLS